LNQIVHAARVGLSNSIHDGFMFTLVAVSFAIVAAILMKNIRLGDRGAGQDAPPAAAPAAVPGLKQDRMATGITLEYLARRIEGANGDSPNLISAASRLVPDAEGSERERADIAVDRILRPMAVEALGTSLGRNGANGHAQNGSTPNGNGPLEEYEGEPGRRS
jgi:hypothetical protein